MASFSRSHILKWGVCGLSLSLIWLIVVPFIPAIAMLAYLGYVPETMLPTNLLHLLWHEGAHQRRRIGTSVFADTSRYRPFTLSEDQLQQYYREGWVHLPGVLPPKVVGELRNALLGAGGAPLWPWSINGHMAYDGLLDFYLFSPLGQIASQVFGGGAAFLWSDFRYWRNQLQKLSDWHEDDGECESILLPSNQTARARLRFWVTLDDGVPGPVLVKQTAWNDVLEGQALANYWSGALAPNESGTGDAWVKEGVMWRRFQEVLPRHLAFPQDVRVGDLILHSPCLTHTSPMILERRLVGFLCPTYQPETSRFYTAGKSSPARAARNCKSGLRTGDLTAGHPCFPRAFPVPEDQRGKEVDFTYSGHPRGDGSLWHWYLGFVSRRYYDMARWEGFLGFLGAGMLGSGRPLAWLTCRLILSLGATFVQNIPGTYV